MGERLNIVRKVLKGLRSVKTTLFLVLLMALLSVAGTLFPPAAAARYFGNPLSVLFFLLFCLNILLCTWHRSARAVRAGGMEKGRKRVRVLLDVTLHVSLVILLAGGALKAYAGFVGTQYLFEGYEASTVYSGKEGEEVPLGFSLLVRERVEDWYPFIVRIGVKDAQTGEKLGVLQPMEGKPASLSGGDLRLVVAGYSIEGEKVTLGIETGKKRESAELDLVPGGRTSASVGVYDLSLLAWRRDLKNVRGRVAVLDGGREVKEEWLAVNGRIAYRGWSIFITSWGEDSYRNRYIGAQITRDPGAPVFWTGAVLLALSLPLFLWIRHGRPGGASRERL